MENIDYNITIDETFNPVYDIIDMYEAGNIT